MKKSIKAIFTLSLLLNVLLLSVAVGHVFKQPKHWKGIKSQLSPEAKEIMQAAFKEKKARVMPITIEARQKRRDLENILAAEEFDPVAYDAMAADIHNLKSRFTDVHLSVVRDMASTMSQEDRKKLAAHVSSRLFGRMSRWGKHKRKGSKHGHGHYQEREEYKGPVNLKNVTPMINDHEKSE